jgi:succinyl-CoA synthetase beta subunit
MDLHEFQAKFLLKEFGIENILNGFLISKKEEIESVLQNAFLKNSIVVLKAQVHAGGRGKAGGVKVCKSLDEAANFANSMLGTKLVTKQTSAEGQYISSIYCEAGCNIDKEFYLSFIVDRAKNCVSIICSSEGGMDIEEVAEKNPNKIGNVIVDFISGYMPFHTRKICAVLGLDLKKYFKKLHDLLVKMYSFFVAKDLNVLEVNPLVLTKGSEDDLDGNFILLDAKLNVDDNSLFRHQDVVQMRDRTQEDPLESKAKDKNLSYVKLDGSVGCMVNGAGLAMATMDIIQHYGQKPANFLDVGGGADQEGVKTALNIILDDKSVKAILINIFGGIVRCDMIANAIVGAVKDLINNGVQVVPIVARLSGTNSSLGSKILLESGIEIIPASDLDDAARKVIDLV